MCLQFLSAPPGNFRAGARPTKAGNAHRLLRPMTSLLLSTIKSGLRVFRPSVLYSCSLYTGEFSGLVSHRSLSCTQIAMSTDPVPPFKHDFVPQHTESPNPAFVYGSTVSQTEGGTRWVEGEKTGWKVVDPATEEPASVASASKLDRSLAMSAKVHLVLFGGI